MVGSGSGDNGITIFSGTSNNSSLFLADGTTATNGYRGSINYLHNGDALTLHANATETMRLTNGKVGIGLSNPNSFHVSGDDLVVGNTTGGHGLTIVASTNDAGSINFGDATNASTRGKITYEHSNDSLAFHAGAAEKFRVGANGNFSIGTTADSARLNVNTSNSGVAPNSSADDLFVESSGHTGITIGSGSSHLSSIYFANSSDNDIGKIEVDHAAGQMRFHNNTSERLRIHSNGVVSVPSGIALGVGTANTASNVLDDYEEGTWTPTLTTGTSAQDLKYTKIGNVVHISGSISFSSVSGSGVIEIGGLPFTSTSHADSYTALNSYAYKGLNMGDAQQFQTLRVNLNSTNMRIIAPKGDGQIRAFGDHSQVNGGYFLFRVGGFYTTN